MTSSVKNKYHAQWIGVDLDGTLAYYDHYRGDNHVGAPTPLVSSVRQWVQDGLDVRIFTARKPHPAIRRWCKEHLGKVLPITSTKDSGMIAFLDDRAIGIRHNTGKPYSESNVKDLL